jgi:RHS repeat-associated protein
MMYPDSPPKWAIRMVSRYKLGTGLLDRVSGSDLLEYAVYSGYQPTGKIGRVDHENNTASIYDYDPLSTRLMKITTHDSTGLAANDIQRKRYEYSGAGDIEAIIDEKDGNKTYAYVYDGLHRLTSESINGVTAESYVYSPTGNITSKTDGTGTYAYVYHSTRKHALSRIIKDSTNYNFASDNNGNMTSGYDFSDPLQVATRTISYNVENMPVSITHVKGGVTTQTQFAYDGDGGRVKKTLVGTGTTYYIGNHIEKINGTLVKYIFAGGMRVARISGTTKLFFHKDHLGSSTAMSDMNGLAIQSSAYRPFGQERIQPGSTPVAGYKFTDQELDASTGLYDYGARMYDPVLGRFITADSIVPSFSNPQSLNRYSYCLNNPLIYVDPTGHFSLKNFIHSFVSGFVGGVVAAICPPAWGPMAAFVLGGMSAGATAGALSGGGLDAIVQGTVMGGVMGLTAGGLYMAGVPGWALVAGGAAGSYATGGPDGLLYFGAGFTGGMAGYYCASMYNPAGKPNFGSKNAALPDELPTGDFPEYDYHDLYSGKCRSGDEYGPRLLFGKPDNHLGIDIIGKGSLLAIDRGTILGLTRDGGGFFFKPDNFPSNSYLMFYHQKLLLGVLRTNIPTGTPISSYFAAGVTSGEHVHIALIVNGKYYNPNSVFPTN